MNKYLVVSYDDDQQQWFFDYVLAPSIEGAEAYVGKVRSYVTAATARPLANVEVMLADLQRGETDFDTSEPLSECQDCGGFWRPDDLLPVKDSSQRVAPNEPMPSGECPACGAVCHEVEQVRP